MKNLLIDAVRTYDQVLNMEADIMVAIGGKDALKNFDEELHTEVYNLIGDAWNATIKLSDRARTARLNAIWKDFVKKYSTKQKQLTTSEGA